LIEHEFQGRWHLGLVLLDVHSAAVAKFYPALAFQLAVSGAYCVGMKTKTAGQFAGAGKSLSGAEVVASRAPLGKGFECPACRLDSIDVPAGNLMAGFLGDVAIQAEQVSFRSRPEADFTFFHSARLLTVLRGKRAGV